MNVDVASATRMVKAAASADPRTGLDAIVALRDLLELSERLQVDAARAAGWSWRDIADRLGVSKQAVHHKHAHRPRGR